MTDIAALIERGRNTIAYLREHPRQWDGGDVINAIKPLIDALSRLTTPPLPAEIAGLIERWEKRIAWTAKWEIDDRLDNDTLAALRAQAQEAQRWKTIATDWHRDCDDKSERIHELEVERDNFKGDAERAIGHAAKFAQEANAMKNERDIAVNLGAVHCADIRRKTIEDVVKTIAAAWNGLDTQELVEAIRALAHSESERKEES